MQNLSPFIASYQLALSEGTHQPDDVQREAVNRPTRFIRKFSAKPADAVQSSGAKRRHFAVCSAKAHGKRTGSWIIYVWVGRSGKTSVDGHVHQSSPGTRPAKRLHFTVLCRVHEELTAPVAKPTRWRLWRLLQGGKRTCSASTSFCVRY